MLHELDTILLLGAAVGVISTTITKARVFREWRMFLKRHSKWWGDLFSCAYCMSHWVAGAAITAAVLWPIFPEEWPVYYYVIVAVILVLVATLTSALIQLANPFNRDPDPADASGASDENIPPTFRTNSNRRNDD